MPEVAAGIDIGGGSAKIGLLDRQGRLVRTTQVTTPETNRPGDLVDAYLEPVKAWLGHSSGLELLAIGVGVPGHVIEDHTATNLSNIPVLDRYPLAEHINERLGVQVSIENDATYAGLGEYVHGAGQGSDRFLMTTLGTGIGSAFIENGKIVTTSNGTIGDSGHMIVDNDLRHQCRKGCTGCLESVASGLALTRDANSIATSEPDSYLGRIRHFERRELTVRDLIDGSRDGDEYCRDKVDETARWIGMWAASMVHLFRPDLYVWGGGWSAAGQEFLDQIHRWSSHASIAYYFDDLRFSPAILGNDAGIIGAASDAMSKVPG